MRGLVVWAVLCACGQPGKKKPDAGLDGGPSIDAPMTDAGIGPDAQIVANPPDGTDRSGTRLRRRIFITVDGFKDQFGWFDTLLGTNCTFSTLSDGSSRCIPAAAPEQPVHYTNAACTDRVLWASAPLTATYVTTQENCERRVWKNFQLSTASTFYIRNFMGTCIATSNTGYHYTATEAPASEFVGATLALEGSSAELKARVRTTDDGGRELLHMYSPSLASPCHPDLLSDGAVRCAPFGADSGESSPPSFADATCTQLVRTFGLCVAIPSYRMTYAEPSSQCFETRNYAPMTAYSGALYKLINSQCEAATLAPGVGYGAVGAPLTPTAFVAESSRAVGPTATRVRGYYSVYADGSVGPRLLWDTVHAVECDFNSDSNGVFRCMPDEYFDLTGAYADASCTQPLADSNGDTCAPGRRPDWARGAAGTYHRITGVFTGSTIYANTGSGCMPIAPIDPPLYTLGPAITDWDVGTRMTE